MDTFIEIKSLFYMINELKFFRHLCDMFFNYFLCCVKSIITRSLSYVLFNEPNIRQISFFSIACLCFFSMVFFSTRQWRILRCWFDFAKIILPWRHITHTYRCGENRFDSLVDYRSQVEPRAGATMSTFVWARKSTNVRLHTESRDIGQSCGHVPGGTRPPGRTSMQYLSGHRLFRNNYSLLTFSSTMNKISFYCENISTCPIKLRQ